MGPDSRAAKPTPSPLIVAHRGAHRELPENTLAAFREALAAGSDGIEFDVQLSADGVPVVHHDRTLVRVGGGRRRIGDLPLRELRSLEPGGTGRGNRPMMRMPTLAEILKRFGGRTRLFIEIKSREADRRSGRSSRLTAGVVEALRRRAAAIPAGQFTLLSFDRKVIETAGRLAPRWSYVLNVERAAHFRRLNFPRRTLLSGCCLPVKELTPSFARRLHRDGLQVMTYACNVPRQLRRALEAEADVIMSDDPARALAYVRARSPD